ncbi:MAG: sigma-70 family RNA polymerase sigma factor [Eubacterium sp.]|nr:sigma-70 family RNA polymerase sigma factor [Eubacterium sp.]
MKSWMFQILANTCKTSLSKRKAISNDRYENVQDTQNREEYMDLYSCICSMESKFREVVILYYFDELKTREIAKILNISEGTVKSRLSRAREKLKKYLV